MWHTELKLEVDLEEKRKRLDPLDKILKEANNKVELEKDRKGDTVIRDEKWTEEERRQSEAKALLPPTLAMVQKEMRQARKAVKKVLSNAKALRQAHLEDRASLAAYDGAEDKTTAICNIMRAEAQRILWARIRRGMGRNKKSGLSHVLVENEDGSHDRISEKITMEAAIISRNIEHFSQADG
jgi:AAA+ ATPase superfamily predicted ATPase